MSGWQATRYATGNFHVSLQNGSVAATPELCQKSGWFLIPFDPETDSVEDAVARVFRALKEKRS